MSRPYQHLEATREANKRLRNRLRDDILRRVSLSMREATRSLVRQ
jgi:hypothetical protein